NARDAMPGVGKLTIETANFDIDKDYIKNHLPAAQPGCYMMLSISDNGCGMDKATQAKIFDPFFTTKELGKGTGLGLSTVYGIVKQNKGYIWVYSEPGQGTTFKIYFPCVDKTVQVEKRVHFSAKSLEGSEVILIVDDDPGIRELSRDTLSSYGYNILEAENGEEALAICNEHKAPIHLIITDVVMPKMGGRELEKNISRLYPEIKVLFVSGYTDNAMLQHGVLEEGVAFLEKPFRPVALAQKAREVLDSSQNQEGADI
ncbi:MAG: response regulator, partial [Calditrichia bacterium]|nr:response regulator [Calditrichia bacterium]